MIIKCKNKNLDFTIDAPPSKSIYHRELIVRFLCGDYSHLEILGTDSEDVRATKIILQILHNTLIHNDQTGENRKGTLYIPCYESGSTLRFLIPVASALILGNGHNHYGIRSLHFSTTGRLYDRPIKELADAMKPHDFRYEKHPDTRSIVVTGEITPGEYIIDGGVSSQYISGLLMALTLFEEPCSVKVVGDITSAPYIELTLDALAKYGCPVRREGNVFYPVTAGYKKVQENGTVPAFEVEGDWSNGAFLLCLQKWSDIKVGNLNPDSKQGDRAILDYLKLIDDAEKGLVDKTNLTWDVSDTPDIAPYMAMMAPFAFDKITFTGTSRLKLKESDRAQAIREQLAEIGVQTEETDDSLTVYSYNSSDVTASAQKEETSVEVPSIKLSSYNDHRMAMCAILLAVILKADIELDDIVCIRKSFPEFLDYIEEYFL